MNKKVSFIILSLIAVLSFTSCGKTVASTAPSFEGEIYATQDTIVETKTEDEAEESEKTEAAVGPCITIIYGEIIED